MSNDCGFQIVYSVFMSQCYDSKVSVSCVLSHFPQRDIEWGWEGARMFNRIFVQDELFLVHARAHTHTRTHTLQWLL